MTAPSLKSLPATKVRVGILVGAILGLLDGLSSYLTPAVRPIFLLIVLGSTLKGFVTGLLTGVIATRTGKLWPSITTGILIGLTLSFLAAIFTPDPSGRHYYLQIMLPGAVLGAVVGFATQKYGGPRNSQVKQITTRN